MDVDGKVAMLEECTRRACTNANGEVDTKVLQHVRYQTRAWTSDGADLHIPQAASASFPNLVFHGWDEAHSAQKLAENCIFDGEIKKTDQLLVTGRKPYSLAKFLSTSLVFKQKVGNAQLAAEDVAFV